MKWTADNIPDQSGRIAIVTGANSGLGFETARALADKGAHVVMACRSMGKAKDALSQIQAETAQPSLEIMKLDLANLESVERFAQTFATNYDSLDLLINNAGIMAIPRRTTAQGFEMQFGTNHLGHFALAGHLLPLLMSTPESRVVTVSSMLHHRGSMGDFNDLHMQESYDKWAAYGRSKLANLLFAFELQRRLEAAGSHVLSTGAHPGYAATNLQHVGPEMEGNPIRKFIMTIANSLVAQDQAKGALPTLYAATAPDVKGCDYIGPDGFNEVRGYPTKVDPSAEAKDETIARRLWEESVEMTGVTYKELTPVTA